MLIIRNRLLSLIYRVLGASVAIAALSIAIPMDYPNNSMFYFQVWTGIAAAIFFIWVSFWNVFSLKKGITGDPNHPNMVAAVGVVLFNLMNLLIFLLIDVPTRSYLHYESKYIFNTGTILLNIVVPAVVILEWVLFEQKGSINFYYGFYYLIIPIIYIGVVYFRKALTETEINPSDIYCSSCYPYLFMDPDFLQKGPGWTFLYNVIFVLSAFGIGEVLILLDHLMAGSLFVKKY